MRFSSLPPVRRAIPISRGNAAAGRSLLRQLCLNRQLTLFSSGTAALARALAECAAAAQTETPEVVLPAYGCPDLIAACLHSAVLPRLVDLAPSAWAYDYAALDRAVSADTVAIVAVNLLGLGDDSPRLSRYCRERGISLVQDSAQFFPRGSVEWSGDYVVFSFGRGKPMNLLRGGALLGPPDSRMRPPMPPAHCSWADRLFASRLAAIAFNALTRPHAYWAVSALPGTGLGDVSYHPLHSAIPLPYWMYERVAVAFELYRQHPSYSNSHWKAAVVDWATVGIEQLTGTETPPDSEPLRLALLAPDRAARDALVRRLNHNGLGASPFYGSDLPRLPGIPEIVQRQGPFPCAANLADRLFTLPTHTLVTPRAVLATRATVCEWSRSIGDHT